MIAHQDPALWASLATIVGVWSLTVVSPGPNFLATSHAAASHSRRAGVLIALGIAVGTTIWATASLLGLALLFQTAGWLYQLVKYAGAAYLILVGLSMMFSARQSGRAQAVAAQSPLRALRYGLLVDLSNPKAAAFFTSLFALAVPPQAPGWFQALVVVLVVAIAGGWYALVACAMAAPAVSNRYRAAQRGITRVTGGVFVFFGVGLATERS